MSDIIKEAEAEVIATAQQPQQPKAAVILAYDGYTIIVKEGMNFVEGQDPDGRIMAVSRELFRRELYDLFTKYLYVPQPHNGDGTPK